MATHATTWWHRYNAEIEALSPQDRRWLSPDPLVPAHLLDLLDEVEGVFQASRTVPDWTDPLADSRSPYGRREAREEEYSRVTHPERYRVVRERADAWAGVLLGRGLAREVDHPPPCTPQMGEPVSGGEGWLLRPHDPIERVREIRPLRAGALPMVLARTRFEDGAAEGLIVAT